MQPIKNAKGAKDFLKKFSIPYRVYLIGSILTSGGILQLGPLYYLYLFALIIFCLNSINILAGVNGLEGMSESFKFTVLFDWYRMNHIISLWFVAVSITKMTRLWHFNCRTITSYWIEFYRNEVSVIKHCEVNLLRKLDINNI